MNLPQVKYIAAPPFCEREALRYAGGSGDEATELLKTCFREAEQKLSYQVCYLELPLRIEGSNCDFGAFAVDSAALSKNLASCDRVLLFGATVGMELDRLIAKYGRIAPSKALMMQAIGAERIEALCDAFCEQYEAEHCVGFKPRFSPGYGDLTLEMQRDIFRVLQCGTKIGLYINDSLLMSPSKSVTAIAGITAQKQEKYNKCSLCGNKGCAFRSIS